MKKILGIISSPRKLGNCELAVKSVSASIPEEHELKIIRLSDFRIGPCRACYKCLFTDKECDQDDDIPLIVDSMADADAFILAVPCYFLGPNNMLKQLLDRGLYFYSQGEKIWGKPAVGIAVAGIVGKEGYTMLGIESFLKNLLADIKYKHVFYSAFPGEILLSKKNIEKIMMIGQSLFGEFQKSNAPSCPLCGGNTFRFYGGNKVKCMLCSNEGIINTENREPGFEIKADKFELFLSKDKAVEHKKWLQDMKTKFFREKEQLIEIRNSYKDGWEWIKPDKIKPEK